MLSTTRTARSKKPPPPIRKKAASASLTSLFSSITTGSSGSNSTVTQESYGRGRHAGHRTARHGPRRKGASSPPPPPLPSHPQRKAADREAPTSAPREDVFKYLESEDDEEESSRPAAVDAPMPMQEQSSSGPQSAPGAYMLPSPPSSPDSAAKAPVAPPLQTGPAAATAAAAWAEEPASAGQSSFYSDSGISIRSTSPEREAAPAKPKRASGSSRGGGAASPARPAFARPRRTAVTSARKATVAAAPAPDPLDSPEAFYHRALPAAPDPPPVTTTGRRLLHARSKAAPPRPQPAPAATRPPFVPPPPAQPASLPAADDPGAGAAAAAAPTYRAFDALTRRALLDLQRELQAMERDLAHLDRRAGAGAGADEQERWQRAQIAALLPVKLELYHRTMAAWRAMRRLPRAADGSAAGGDALLDLETPAGPLEACPCRRRRRRGRRRYKEGPDDMNSADDAEEEDDDDDDSALRLLSRLTRKRPVIAVAPVGAGGGLAVLVYGSWSMVLLLGLMVAGGVLWVKGVGGLDAGPGPAASAEDDADGAEDEDGSEDE